MNPRLPQPRECEAEACEGESEREMKGGGEERRGDEACGESANDKVITAWTERERREMCSTVPYPSCCWGESGDKEWYIRVTLVGAG